MKTTAKLFYLITVIVFTQGRLNAQEICLVTADYQTGEDCLILWEQFPDLTGLDSVLVYRADATTPFTFIGGEKIGVSEPTIYRDTTADTKAMAKYVIYVKDSAGGITGPSLYHQPISIDYDVDGIFTIVPYEKEGGAMYYYSAFKDPTGLGFYQYLSTSVNYTTYTFDDQTFAQDPNANYYLETYVDECTIQTKADINTSRSNIKQQVSTASLGVYSKEKPLVFTVSPNPTSDELLIQLDEVANATIWVSNLVGDVYFRSSIHSSSAKLDVDELAAGVYFLNIKSNDIVSSQKFVKR